MASGPCEYNSLFYGGFLETYSKNSMVFKDLGRDALAFLLGVGRTLIGIYLYAHKTWFFSVVFTGYTSV